MTDSAEAAPAVRLLDGRAAQLDERSLRSAARVLSRHCGAAASSRSYRYPYAIVAWHSGDVGVDIEQVTRTDAALANLICTPAERAELACADDRDGWLSSLWCAKEALSKALGDATVYDPSRLNSPTRWPVMETLAAEGGSGEAAATTYDEVRGSGRWRAARLRVPPGHVGWLCWSSDLGGSPPAGGD
jgi:phosphopantetheinyl transferase (holo-ACP synthase)